MNLHPTKKESKAERGLTFQERLWPISSGKTQLAEQLRGLEGDVHLAATALLSEEMERNEGCGYREKPRQRAKLSSSFIPSERR
jgi:hypothetical protein